MRNKRYKKSWRKEIVMLYSRHSDIWQGDGRKKDKNEYQISLFDRED